MTRLRWDKDRSGPGYRTVYISEKPLEITMKKGDPEFYYSPEEVKRYNQFALERKRRREKERQERIKRKRKRASQKNKAANKIVKQHNEHKGKESGTKEKTISRTAVKMSERRRQGKLAGELILRPPCRVSGTIR